MLADGVFAGFVITRPIARPSYVSEELMPPEIVSLSDCIAPSLPGGWCLPHPQLDDAWRATIAARFVIDVARLPDVADWMDRAAADAHLAWPTTFTSLDTAREFLQRFDVPADGLVVLAMELARPSVSRYVDEWGGVPAAAPLIDLLRRDRPLPSGGSVLGWEPLGSEWFHSFHSWLCNGFEKTAHAELGVRPNAAGLIDDAETALRVAELCDAGGGEPVSWNAWRITRWDASLVSSKA